MFTGSLLLLPTHSTTLPSQKRTLGVQLEDHEYFRPSGDQVSGFPTDNTAQYHRSPCPALNSLANHGYIPRDGKDLTPAMLHQALMRVYNLDDGLASRFTGVLPSQLTLADLSVHGFIEHDASLVHDDTFSKTDPSRVNETLATALLATDEAGVLTKHSLAHFRHLRESECARENPQYALPAKAQLAAYGESALLLVGLGDYDRATLSVAHARYFLVDERVPADFCQDREPLCWPSRWKSRSWFRLARTCPPPRPNRMLWVTVGEQSPLQRTQSSTFDAEPLQSLLRDALAAEMERVA